MNSVSNSFNDEDLPLPSFQEVFGNYSLINSRRKDQILQCEEPKTKKSLPKPEKQLGDESTGRWTPEEHRLFLEGIMLYGKDWKRMQPLIKTRTLVQIRTHAQKVFKKIGIKRLNEITTGILPTESSIASESYVAYKRQRVDEDVRLISIFYFHYNDYF